MSIRDQLIRLAEEAELAAVGDLQTKDLQMALAQIALGLRIQAVAAGRLADRNGRHLSDLIKAENRADEFADSLRRLKQITNKAQQHQAVVADCMTWFAGFEAAHVHRDGWERPWTPDREALRALNIALQAVAYPEPADADDEIPF